jgi:hypothetical protein
MGSRVPGTKDTVYLHLAGMRELLKSQPIRAGLVVRMASVQAALPGSKLEAVVRPSRVVVKVARGSDFDEANTGDLSRALDLAGGQRGTKKKFGASARKNRRRGS